MPREPDWDGGVVLGLEEWGLANLLARQAVADQRDRRDDALRRAIDDGMTWPSAMAASGLSRRGVKLARDRASCRPSRSLDLAVEAQRLARVQAHAEVCSRELDRAIVTAKRNGVTWEVIMALTGLSRRGLQLALKRRE